MRKYRHLIQHSNTAHKAACKILLLSLFAFFNADAGRVIVEFKESQTTHLSNEIASNMLKVVNGSDKKLNFYLSLNLPLGWSSTKLADELYTLDAGDSLFIPVKLMFKGREAGNVNNLIAASLLSDNNRVQFAAATWYMLVQEASNWVASVDKMEAFFIHNTDTSCFSLAVRNTGNATEWFIVKIASYIQLQTYYRENMAAVPAYFNFSLPPGTDTLIQFVVQSKQLNKTGYQNQNSRDNANQAGEKYPLKIQVQTLHKDKTPDKTWKATIDFKRNHNEIRFNEFSRMVLPLTVEARIDNLMESSTSLNLNLYGTAMLEHSRTLTYRVQSFFTDQYLNGKSYSGNYHYIAYFTPKYSVEGGNITGWSNFGQSPSGIGARGDYNFNNNKVGLLYIQSPKLFVSPSSRTIGLRDILSLKEFSITNYYQQTWNELGKSNGKLFITGGDYRIRHQHIFSVRIGASNEYFYGALSPFTKTGIGSSLNYSGTVRDFNFNFSSDYGSAYYSGYRGIMNINYGVTYKQNEKYTWGFFNSFYNQRPVYFDQEGNKYDNYKSSGQHFELKWTANSRFNSCALKAGYYNDDQVSIHYITRSLGFDYRPISKSGIRFFSSIVGSYIKLPDYSIQDYFTAQVRTSFRCGSFTTNIRYNYGPYQAFEHLRFAQYRINYQSMFINSYYGFWLYQHLISLEPSLNYSYETLYKKGRLSLRPELLYFSKSGWEFNAYAELMMSSQKIARLVDINKIENTQETATYKDVQLGVGIKKNFGIPIPGKRFYTLKIVAFKDLNGNMKQDRNEEVLENILVNIKPANADSTSSDDLPGLKDRGEDLVTDNKGLVILRNLPVGLYKITTRSLVESEGWFTMDGMLINLSKSQELLIPFTLGVHILGSITVSHNVNLAARLKEPAISRIRVTAVDSAGRVYSCLTSDKGTFELYVPVGDYRITVNQNAIDNDFELEQNLIILSLDGKIDAYNINFNIREKERLMNIKKFSSDGTLLEDKQ